MGAVAFQQQPLRPDKVCVRYCPVQAQQRGNPELTMMPAAIRMAEHNRFKTELLEL